MEDQIYSADSSGPTPLQHGAPTSTGKSIEQASPWPLASQIRQLLGEDYEIDPSFFEESWTSGLSAAVESCRYRRDQPAAKTSRNSTFAELSGLGTFFFSQADAWQADHTPYASAPTASYAASWLQEPLEEPHTRTQNQTLPGEPAAPEEHASGRMVLDPLLYQRACELLSVSKYSSEVQIKAAYRRMVSQWHPDRLEGRSKEVRELATRQMAAINEAYHLLRSHPSMAFS